MAPVGSRIFVDASQMVTSPNRLKGPFDSLIDKFGSGILDATGRHPSGLCLANSCGKRVGKQYLIRPDGSYDKRVDADEKWWTYRALFFPSLDVLAEVIRFIQDDDHKLFLRGGLVEGTDIRFAYPRRIAGGVHEDSLRGVHEDVPRHICGLDFDDKPMPTGCSYDDPHELVRAMCEEYSPPSLRGVRSVWQFGASARIKGPDILSGHRYVAVDDAINSHDLCGLCAAWGVDASYNRVVQPQYTARPRLWSEDGRPLPDPLRADRVILYEGSRETADVSADMAKFEAERLARIEARKRRVAVQGSSGAFSSGAFSGGAMARDYIGLLKWIAKNRTGYAAGASYGYRKPLFDMLRAGLMEGERDLDRLRARCVKMLFAAAEANGDLDAKLRDLESYTADDVLDDVIDRIAEHNGLSV